MKRIITITLMLLMVTVASAQEGKNIYNKYSGNEGVTAIYISPVMFRMIGNLPDLDVQTSNGESVNLAPLIKTLQGIYILEVSDSDIKTSIQKDVSSMIHGKRYEMLMEVKDELETIRMYTAGNEEIIESFVFVVTDTHSLNFICIDGAINREELDTLIAGAIK